jgi:hypothetical protein
VPQLGKNGLQLGCVLCGYCLGTQFADSLLQGYIERHKAPLVYMYRSPGDSSIPYTLYFQVNVTSRDCYPSRRTGDTSQLLFPSRLCRRWGPAELILGADGNFSGTTGIGGANFSGTVFKITPQVR